MLRNTLSFIYFDLDDTLLDHKKAEENGLKDVHQSLDELKNIPIEELLSTYSQINKGLWMEYGKGLIDRYELHRRRFQETFEALGIDGSLYAHAGSIYMNYYRTHWTWVKGAKKAYETIKKKYKTGIITNGFAETQWLKINQFGFQECAPAIIISEELGVMKPHQKIFTEAVKRAESTPEQILYVGDSLSSDVDGATEAGWSVAWFNPKKNSPEGRRPTIEFDDFDTLVSLLGA